MLGSSARNARQADTAGAVLASVTLVCHPDFCIFPNFFDFFVPRRFFFPAGVARRASRGVHSSPTRTSTRAKLALVVSTAFYARHRACARIPPLISPTRIHTSSPPLPHTSSSCPLLSNRSRLPSWAPSEERRVTRPEQPSAPGPGHTWRIRSRKTTRWRALSAASPRLPSPTSKPRADPTTACVRCVTRPRNEHTHKKKYCLFAFFVSLFKIFFEKETTKASLLARHAQRPLSLSLSPFLPRVLSTSLIATPDATTSSSPNNPSLITDQRTG